MCVAVFRVLRLFEDVSKHAQSRFRPRRAVLALPQSAQGLYMFEGDVFSKTESHYSALKHVCIQGKTTPRVHPSHSCNAVTVHEACTRPIARGAASCRRPRSRARPPGLYPQAICRRSARSRKPRSADHRPQAGCVQRCDGQSARGRQGRRATIACMLWVRLRHAAHHPYR